MQSFRLFAILSFGLTLGLNLAQSQNVSFNWYRSTRFGRGTADFNSDGRADFINSRDCTLSQLGLVLSRGNTGFAPTACYVLPSGHAYDLAIGDFNGDGNADIVTVDNSNTFYEFLGSPSGKLSLRGGFTASTGLLAVTAADVNHDGKIDLLFWGGDYNLWAWFGNGDGTFTVGPAVPMSNGGDLYIGDFDGDGKADIFAEHGEEGGPLYQVFYGDGDGHFLPSAGWGDDVGYRVYDVNGDGNSDLIGDPFYFSIGGNLYYNDTRVLYGNANRTFTQRDITLAKCDPWGTGPAVADYNGDGINDLALIEDSDCKGSGPDSFNVLLGNPDGTYQPEQAIFTGPVNELLGGPMPLRADRDNRPDLLLFNFGQNDGYVDYLFQNTTSGNFPACNAPPRFDAITLCSPTMNVAPSSPVQFSVGAANQTPGRKVEVWIDGKKMSEQLKGAFSYFSFLDASYQLSNGTHQVTIFSAGWDNMVQSIRFPLTVGSSTCSPPQDPGINVCSPLNYATVNSPVLAWASGTVTGTVAGMDVKVDGVEKYRVMGTNTLKFNIPPDPGVHRFDFFIANTEGQKWQQSVYVEVP